MKRLTATGKLAIRGVSLPMPIARCTLTTVFKILRAVDCFYYMLVKAGQSRTLAYRSSNSLALWRAVDLVASRPIGVKM
jgi:hypothetical protein